MSSRLMASKFAIGDKVDQSFSNHAEGTVVAIFENLAGERRYAIEMFGHRTIQIATEGSLVARGNHPSHALRYSGPLLRPASAGVEEKLSKIDHL